MADRQRTADRADIDYPWTEDAGWENEKRVESGPGGGQWTSGGGGGGGGGKAAEPSKPSGGAPAGGGGGGASGGGSPTAGGASGNAMAIEGPASRLLPSPRKYSLEEAHKIGQDLADKFGIRKEYDEAQAKVDALGGKQTIDPVEKGGFMTPGGNYTPEREAKHREILAKLFTPEAIARARPGPGETPTVTILGGRGGSGKSALTRKPDGPVDGTRAIVVDADWFKGELPEFEGWNAGQVHEESSDLVQKAEELAMRMRLNVVHDATLKSTKSILERVDRYRKQGYAVDGHFMHLAPEVAVGRAIKRYADGLKKEGKGRFVAPEIILGNRENERNFDRLAPSFRVWSLWDNSGDKAKFVAGSGTPNAKDRRAKTTTITIRTGRDGAWISSKSLHQRSAYVG